MFLRAVLVASVLVGCTPSPRSSPGDVCGSDLSPPAVPGVPAAAGDSSPGVFVSRELFCFDAPHGLTCYGDWGRQMVESGVTLPRAVDGACALDHDGSLRCLVAPFEGTPFEGEAPPTGTYTTLSAIDERAVCVLDTAGEVTCLLGGPKKVPKGPFVDVVATHGAACGLSADGTIRCASDTPTCFADPPPGAWASITGSGGAACAIDGAGNVSCWGSTALFTPLPTRAKMVSLDLYEWCAITQEDAIVCSGATWAETPVPDGKFRYVDVYTGTACAVRDTGEPVCFSRTGQRGDQRPWWPHVTPPGWVAIGGSGWRAALPSLPVITEARTADWTVTSRAAQGSGGEAYVVSDAVPGPDVSWDTPDRLLDAFLSTHEASLAATYAWETYTMEQLPRGVPARRYEISFDAGGTRRRTVQHVYALPDRIVVVSVTGGDDVDALPLTGTFEIDAR